MLGKAERGNSQFGRYLPRFIHNQQIDRIIERRIPLPIVRTNHVFRQRMESRNKNGHHTGQTFQPFGVILAATCLPLFIASGQAADELGFPVMDGIPEQKIAVTDIQPHRHIFRIRKGIIFRIGNQLVIACLKIFRLLPAAYHIIIAWKFLKFTEQFTQKTFIRHLFSILFETGNIQAGSNLIPHLPHLPAKEALACNFIPARCLKETIEMFQIEPAIFFQPGRIVIIIRKAFTFRIEHHFVLILLFVFARQIQSQRIQTRQPAESQQVCRLIARRLFDLEIFQDIGNRLVIGGTGYDDIRIIRMLQYGMDDPVGNHRL